MRPKQTPLPPNAHLLINLLLLGGNGPGKREISIRKLSLSHQFQMKLAYHICPIHVTYSCPLFLYTPFRDFSRDQHSLTISSVANNTIIHECLERKIRRNKQLVPLFPSVPKIPVKGVFFFYICLVLSHQFNQPTWLV